MAGRNRSCSRHSTTYHNDYTNPANKPNNTRDPKHFQQQHSYPNSTNCDNSNTKPYIYREGRSPIRGHNPGETRSLRSNSIDNRAVHGPCGLQNIGNSCYMNSVLQCLSNIQDLKDFFLKTKFTKDSLLSLYAELMKAMPCECDLQKPLNQLKHYTSKYSSSFHGYGQADAREFLNVLLNAFHDELIKWYPQSPINQLFTITIESQMICKMCGHTESTGEPMNFLPLRLNAQDKSKTTLDDLLHTFEKEKIINGQLRCLQCRRISEHCERRILGPSLPKVIIVHFTRFSSTRTKDDTAVVFPLMYNFSDPSRSNQSSYELIGVITHMGSIHGGHFIAYTKYHQNEWYCCDDAIVRRIGQLDPMKLARDAYILFYAKQY